MVTKALVIGAVVTIMKVVIMACCGESELKYTLIKNLHLTNTNLNEELPHKAIVNSDSFRIKLTMDLEFIAQIDRYLPAQLFATSCENMGLDGLKTDIRRVTITSDKAILGIQPGDNLNFGDRIMVYEDHFFDDSKNKRLTIQEWMEIMNNGRYEQSHYEWYFEFTQRIETSDYVMFKVIIEWDDNSVTTLQTQEIILS